MKQKQYNRLATVYAIIGFILVLAILISQIATKQDIEIQSLEITTPSDSIDANSDTLDYNWEDIGF